VATAGTVSFNGKTKQLPAGASVSLSNIAPGDYPVSVAYADGQSETRTVRIEAGKAAAVAFSYQPAESPIADDIRQDVGTIVTNSIGMKFMPVPGGKMQLGSGVNVSLATFLMASTEVTQAQYQKVMGNNPSKYVYGDGARNRPVEGINWYDAVEFCNALSRKEGLLQVYSIDKSRKDPNIQRKEDTFKWIVTMDMQANGYRLPTEAEWEYAARGGLQSEMITKFAGSNSVGDVAWYKENTYKFGPNSLDYGTHPVASKKPNSLGIFDLSGNVWEWCWDWRTDEQGRGTDPTGPRTGNFRVLRGGSWKYDPNMLAVAERHDLAPEQRWDDIGIRLVRR
jgi:formylglycine-generating enzyme required for sulfatase activity